MESTIKKLPNSEIELKIEVSAKELNHFIDQATLNLGKDLEIKGFRKGKASKEIVEEKLGKEKILIEAADLAVKENYQKAVLENKIAPISAAKIEIQKLAQGNSFIFLAKTSILPELKLPDYRKIAAKVEKKQIKIEEKEVADALMWLQKSRAKFILKNQPAQKGDFVEIEYWSSQLDELKQQGQKDAFILGEGHFIPGFEEKLIGMKAGPASAPLSGAMAGKPSQVFQKKILAGKEEKEFSLIIPEKHPLRKYGREIAFKVKINSVQTIELPEINDQLAKGLGKFENLESLKKNIKEGINLEKRQAESRRLRQEILEKISEEVKCDIPEVLVEREQKQIMENIKKQVSEKLKISFTDYLGKIKKTEKEISDSSLAEAQKRVKNFLVLSEIGRKENIEVLEEEIRKETDKMLKQHANVEQTKKDLDLEGLKEYTKEAIRNEKIFQLLENS